jgi:hypothetical protein
MCEDTAQAERAKPRAGCSEGDVVEFDATSDVPRTVTAGDENRPRPAGRHDKRLSGRPRILEGRGVRSSRQRRVSSFAAAGLTVLVWLLQVGPAGAEGVTFDIYEYQVEGNTALPRTAVEKAVYEFLGPARTIEDVEKARAALEKAYRSAGFSTVIVSIPEQQVTEGVVGLQVTEGRIGRVQVTGNRYYSAGYIRTQAPSIREGAVANFPAIQDVAPEFISRATRPPDLASRRASGLRASSRSEQRRSRRTSSSQLLAERLTTTPAGVGYGNSARGHAIGMRVQPRDTSEVVLGVLFRPSGASTQRPPITSSQQQRRRGWRPRPCSAVIFRPARMQPVRGRRNTSSPGRCGLR